VPNEIEITVNGWVAQHPRLVERASGLRMLKLRVGSTPRRRDPLTGAWGDGPTQWFTVIAFRDLAANACYSLHKGDPVLVRGRLALARWEHEGRTYTQNEITADAIGHDLARGTTMFARTVRRSSAEGLVEEPAGEEPAGRGREDAGADGPAPEWNAAEAWADEAPAGDDEEEFLAEFAEVPGPVRPGPAARPSGPTEEGATGAA
jgi:single-strand DNA-binding protein